MPLLLQLVWLGLATGQPFLPAWLELAALAGIGVGPILWMQWTKPFDIFSLPLVALRPQALSEEQCRLLRGFKAPRQRLIALITAGLALWLLLQLYRWAPLLAGVTPLTAQSRGLGLAIAALAFLASHLFLQVPASVGGVLLRRSSSLAALEPYDRDRIAQDFTVLGWPVARILPPLTLPTASEANFTSAETTDATNPEAAKTD